MSFLTFLAYSLGVICWIFLVVLFISLIYVLSKMGVAVFKLSSKSKRASYEEFMEYWTDIGKVFWIKNQK